MERSELFFEQPVAQTVTHVEGHEEPGQAHEIIPGLTSIIIAAHNTHWPLLHYTGHAIGSVHEHTKLPYEIILVDNGSPARLSDPKEYNVDKVIYLSENKGVAAAWNAGIRVSQGEYICLLNNDALVFDNWLEDMQEALQYTDLVMANPMYGEPFSRAREAAQKRAAQLEKPFEESLTFTRDFSCVLAPRELFNLVGVFDEQFFMYCEDSDFLKRMEAAGYTARTCTRVNIFHIISATASTNPDTAEIMNKSKQFYKEKWGE